MTTLTWLPCSLLKVIKDDNEIPPVVPLFLLKSVQEIHDPKHIIKTEIEVHRLWNESYKMQIGFKQKGIHTVEFSDVIIRLMHIALSKEITDDQEQAKMTQFIILWRELINEF